MAKKKQSTPKEQPKKMRPATSPEARENQLISLAVDLAEKQLIEGTASSQVITHYLKLGSTKEKIEREILEQQKGVDTYILFTGDGHFQTVVKCLKEKKKRVIVCGIEDSFSKQLRDTASEVIMVDIEKELFERNCKMVLNSMAMIEDQKDLLANFLQAVENVSKASNIPEEEFGKMLVRALKLGCEKS